MSPCLPKIWHHNTFIKKEIFLAILGLDNAGKTTTTRSIKGIPSELVMPTIGFEPIKYNTGRYDVTIYDLGGRQSIRSIWKNYFAEVHGIIFVVDSVATERLDECKSELCQVLSHPYIAGKPILLLANKQDLSEALSREELNEILCLDKLTDQSSCLLKVETVSALLLPGNKLDPKIRRGIQWLFNTIKDQLPELEKRIITDKLKQRDSLRMEGEVSRKTYEIDSPQGEIPLKSGDSPSVEPRAGEKTVTRKTDSVIGPTESISDFIIESCHKTSDLLHKLPNPRPRRSLPITTKPLRNKVPSIHVVSNTDSRRSMRLLNNKLPRISTVNTKVELNFSANHLSRSKVRQMTEVIEIEELDEVELGQPEQICFNTPTPCPGFTSNSHARDTNKRKCQQNSRSRVGGARKFAQCRSVSAELNKKGSSPSIVKPLYEVARTSPNQMKPTQNGHPVGDRSFDSSPTLKGPSQLARIFKPNINKLHPSQHDLEKEQ